MSNDNWTAKKINHDWFVVRDSEQDKCVCAIPFAEDGEKIAPMLAAAPEMLAALKSLLSHVEHTDGFATDYEHRGNTYDRVNEARAAIAKARGD